MSESTPTKQSKPIAVLANKITDGIDHVRFNLAPDAREINGAKRRVTAKDGTVYIIVTHPDQLRGIEIADFRICPGVGQNKEYHELYMMALSRKR